MDCNLQSKSIVSLFFLFVCLFLHHSCREYLFIGYVINNLSSVFDAPHTEVKVCKQLLMGQVLKIRNVVKKTYC